MESGGACASLVRHRSHCALDSGAVAATDSASAFVVDQPVMSGPNPTVPEEWWPGSLKQNTATGHAAVRSARSAGVIGLSLFAPVIEGDAILGSRVDLHVPEAAEQILEGDDLAGPEQRDAIAHMQAR